MSNLGQTVARQQALNRRRAGDPVTVGCAPDGTGGSAVWAVTDTANADKVGLQFLARQNLGGYAADADPRVFDCTPADFGPYTAAPSPDYGTLLLFAGRGYVARHVAAEQVHGVPVSSLVYAHRVLMGPAALSPVFPTVPATLYRTESLGRRAPSDPLHMGVRDAGYDDLGAKVAFFNPMQETDKLAAFGRMDLRVNRIYTNEALRVGDVLWRPDTREAWLLLGDSELFPSEGLTLAPARYLQDTPPGVGA